MKQEPRQPPQEEADQNAQYRRGGRLPDQELDRHGLRVLEGENQQDPQEHNEAYPFRLHRSPFSQAIEKCKLQNSKFSRPKFPQTPLKYFLNWGRHSSECGNPERNPGSRSYPCLIQGQARNDETESLLKYPPVLFKISRKRNPNNLFQDCRQFIFALGDFRFSICNLQSLFPDVSRQKGDPINSSSSA